MIEHKKIIKPLWKQALWLPPTVMSLFLLVVAQFNPLGFHTLAELFAIVISFILFSVAWSTRKFPTNSILLLIACGYFWIGSLDLLHAFSYKGMNTLVEGNADLAIQFWLSARFSESLLLFLAPFIAPRRTNAYRSMIVFGAIAIGLTALIFSGNFPTGFVEGSGLTDFKIYSEYLIIAILALALFVLHGKSFNISNLNKAYLTVSIVFTILAELAFTFYIDVFGLSNLIGHLFKIYSYWFIFQAIVASTLKEPYKKLTESEERSRNLFENSEISILDEDFLKVYEALEKLQEDGVSDLRKLLKDNEQVAVDMAKLVRVVHVNKATLRLFSANSEDELISQIYRTFSLGGLAVFTEILCAFWDKKKIFRSDTSLEAINGRAFQAIISFDIPSSKEGFASIPVNVINITERRMQRIALEKSEQRYRQFFNNNAAIFLIVNSDNGKIIDASSGACHYYGYSLIELTKMNISDVIILSKIEIAAEMKLAKDEETNHFLFRHRLSSGETREVEVYTNPIFVDGETFLYLIVYDVSERKFLELELNKRTYDLSKRVKEQLCLYSISEIFNRMDISAIEALELAVREIPSGWQYPEITCARIIFDNNNLTTDNFKKTSWKQISKIRSAEKEIGVVEVYYMDEKPIFDIGPFLHEESNLINSIGTVVGSFLEKKANAADILKSQNDLIHAAMGAINAISATVEKRDPYTSGHQNRVAILSVAIATDLGWSDSKKEGLRLGSLIHDIGKIHIPAEILNRPGKLTDAEFSIIKSHPQVGFEIVEHTDFPWPIKEMILQHHERIDGSGYPNGLTGEFIVDEAKVIAVADVVEAITAHRPYRPALGIDAGLEEIERGKGTAYDPMVVDSCLKIIRAQGFSWPE